MKEDARKILFVCTNFVTIGVLILFSFSIIIWAVVIANALIVSYCIWDKNEGLQVPIALLISDFLLLVCFTAISLFSLYSDMNVMLLSIGSSIVLMIFQLGLILMGGYQLFVLFSKPITELHIIIYFVFLLDMAVYISSRNIIFILILCGLILITLLFNPRLGKKFEHSIEEDTFNRFK